MSTVFDSSIAALINNSILAVAKYKLCERDAKLFCKFRAVSKFYAVETLTYESLHYEYACSTLGMEH